MSITAHPPCTSYRRGEGICRDGFPQRPYCRGSACIACGQFRAENLPLCITGEGLSTLPNHLFDGAGRPRLAALKQEGDPHA
jgi:hypothetical protein